VVSLVKIYKKDFFRVLTVTSIVYESLQTPGIRRILKRCLHILNFQIVILWQISRPVSCFVLECKDYWGKLSWKSSAVDAVQEFSIRASKIKRKRFCIKGFLKIAMKDLKFDRGLFARSSDEIFDLVILKEV
jgi:hypothetical protein